MALISTEWLAGHLDDPGVRVCDVRWYLPTTGRKGRAEYEAGHIPGAVFIDLDRDLASPDDGTEGRHPLPTADAFQASMRAAGISPDTHVIAYDDAGGSIAARLWWLLRAHGHSRVSLLDGGTTQWKAEARPVNTELPAIEPGTFESKWNPRAVVTLPELRQALGSGALLFDARARERYRGETEPVDPRPGHIPGAINAPFAESLDRGLFREAPQLREQWRSAVGNQWNVIASCGSGVTACHNLFVLDWTALRPFPSARLYVGSYSEWSRRQELPVATGAEPGKPV